MYNLLSILNGNWNLQPKYLIFPAISNNILFGFLRIRCRLMMLKVVWILCWIKSSKMLSNPRTCINDICIQKFKTINFLVLLIMLQLLLNSLKLTRLILQNIEWNTTLMVHLENPLVKFFACRYDYQLFDKDNWWNNFKDIISINRMNFKMIETFMWSSNLKV